MKNEPFRIRCKIYGNSTDSGDVFIGLDASFAQGQGFLKVFAPTKLIEKSTQSRPRVGSLSLVYQDYGGRFDR